MDKYRVWWIPQVPGEPFRVPVKSVEEGVLIMQTLADYDLFQLKHRIKPDFTNAGGLEVLREWDPETMACHVQWEDWYDEESGIDDPFEWAEQRNRTS